MFTPGPNQKRIGRIGGSAGFSDRCDVSRLSLSMVLGKLVTCVFDASGDVWLFGRVSERQAGSPAATRRAHRGTGEQSLHRFVMERVARRLDI